MKILITLEDAQFTTERKGYIGTEDDEIDISIEFYIEPGVTNDGSEPSWVEVTAFPSCLVKGTRVEVDQKYRRRIIGDEADVLAEMHRIISNLYRSLKPWTGETERG